MSSYCVCELLAEILAESTWRRRAPSLCYKPRERTWDSIHQALSPPFATVEVKELLSYQTRSWLDTSDQITDRRDYPLSIHQHNSLFDLQNTQHIKEPHLRTGITSVRGTDGMAWTVLMVLKKNIFCQSPIVRQWLQRRINGAQRICSCHQLTASLAAFWVIGSLDHHSPECKYPVHLICPCTCITLLHCLVLYIMVL